MAEEKKSGEVTHVADPDAVDVLGPEQILDSEKDKDTNTSSSEGPAQRRVSSLTVDDSMEMKRETPVEHTNKQEFDVANHEPEGHEPEDHEPEDHEPEDHEPEDHEPEGHEPEDHEPGDHVPGDREPKDHEPGDNVETRRRATGGKEPDADIDAVGEVNEDEEEVETGEVETEEEDEEEEEESSGEEEEDDEEFEEEETSSEEEESDEDMVEYENYKRRLINQYIETKKIYRYEVKKNAFLQDKLYQICVRKGFIVENKSVAVEEEKPVKRGKRGSKRLSITIATRIAHEMEENMREEEMAKSLDGDTVSSVKSQSTFSTGQGLKTFLEATLESKYTKIIKRILAAEKSKEDNAVLGDSVLEKMREKNEQAKKIHREKFEALMERVREVSDAAVDSNTGKSISKRGTEAFIEEVTKVYETLVSTLQTMYNNRHGLEFALKRLQETEFQGEGLQMLEYEQLTAENYSLKDKLEDRQKDLEHIKRKIAHAVQVLAHFREFMSKLKEKLEAGANKLQQINTRVYEVRQITDVVTERYEMYKGEEIELVNESGLLDNIRLLRDYEGMHYKTLERREEKRKLEKKLAGMTRETGAIQAQIKEITTHLPEIKRQLPQRSIQRDQVFDCKSKRNQSQQDEKHRHEKPENLQLQWLLVNRNLDPPSALTLTNICSPVKPLLKAFRPAR